MMVEWLVETCQVEKLTWTVIRQSVEQLCWRFVAATAVVLPLEQMSDTSGDLSAALPDGQ